MTACQGCGSEDLVRSHEGWLECNCCGEPQVSICYSPYEFPEVVEGRQATLDERDDR